MIDCNHQIFLGNAQFFRDQFPGKWDRIGFEVIAKAEIAEHLEKRVMARRIAHIVQIIVFAASTHAFLRGRGAGVVPMLQPGEQVFELHHARVCKHQRGVVAGHQRAAIDHGMALLFEIGQKRGSDVVYRAHGGTPFGRNLRSTSNSRLYRHCPQGKKPVKPNRVHQMMHPVPDVLQIFFKTAGCLSRRFAPVHASRISSSAAGAALAGTGGASKSRPCEARILSSIS